MLSTGSMGEPRGRIMLVMRRLAGRAGGAERLYCDTANMFADAGYQVTVVSCDPRGDAPRYRLDPRVERVNLYSSGSRRAPAWRVLDGAATVLPLPPLAWLSQHLYFTRRLYRLARKVRPDVLISFLPPANTPTLIAGALARVKVIPTNHNVPVHD